MSEEDNKIETALQLVLQKEEESLKENSKEHQVLEDGIAQILPKLIQFSLNDEFCDLNGQVFNQYEILKKIGSGGMGDVYLAKRMDGQFEKNLAIKILSQGYLSPDVRNRFLREKQILAELRHPGIVPLVDAGTTEDKVPWFALEFIDGLPIDQFCDKNKLSIEARVRLFLKVCNAIQFAHSHGIIHRDLKPANILVETIDGEFNPVVLDFGIAHKNNAEKLTEQGNIIGTPSFMSPEQIKGDIEQLDRRTDIFSLGVVLYRLLVGKLPFVANSKIDTYEKILNQKIGAIKLAIPDFPKDLQTILETSMKKQTIDRYQSIPEFKQDLQNWLSGFPINARKEKLSTKLWLWFKRNRILAVSAFFISLTSVLFFIKYAYDINTERQLAMESKLESDELLSFMLDDLHKQLTEIGRVDVLEAVAEQSLSHLNKYRRIINSDQYLKQAIIYRNIADVLTMQADIEQSESALLNAKLLLLPLLNDAEHKEKALALLSGCLIDLANLHAKFGQLEKASGEYVEALNYAYELDSKYGDDQDKVVKWQVHNAYVWNLLEENNFVEAKNQLQIALTIADMQLKLSPENADWQQRKLKTLTTYGWYYNAMRELKKSQNIYLQALTLAQELYEKLPNSTPTINGLQRVLNQLSYTYAVDKNFKSAVLYAENAKNIGIKLHNTVPENQVYHRALAYTYTTLGDSYKELGQVNLAEQNFAEGLAITEKLAKTSPNNASMQNDLAIDNMNFGQLLVDKGNLEQGQIYWYKAELAIAPFASQVDASIYYIDTYATVLLMQNKIEKAMPYLETLKNSQGWGNKAYHNLMEKYVTNPNDA